MVSFHACASGAGGRKFLSKALVVILWPLCTATPATARLLANAPRSISPSAGQESFLTNDELIALQEIARALNRNVDLLSNNWSWIKVGLLSFGVLFTIEIVKIYTGIYSGVRTQRIVDRRRQEGASTNAVADPGAQQAAASNRMVTTAVDAVREENQTDSEFSVEEGLKSAKPVHRRDDEQRVPLVVLDANTEQGKEALIDIEDGSRSPERSTSSRRRRLPSSRLFSIFEKVPGFQSLKFW